MKYQTVPVSRVVTIAPQNGFFCRVCGDGPRFNPDEFPSELDGKITREEFYYTMSHLNRIAKDRYPCGFVFKLICFLVQTFMMCICLCFYCQRRKKAVNAMKDFLVAENLQKYSAKGVSWHLESGGLSRYRVEIYY
eukprot:TRINITY_DN3170_c0_g1_i1.p1 TRINITY_DN3170_c0_g1~~TRINITY_DN3170_c0_g1_i1.p1  ORF type:complete len:136 (-),score=26.63 TRINITY_DN3170_c0_g1_i1:224-631(-)